MTEFSHIVIRASAGTGKTFQLSNRYLQLIEAGVSPEEILATTFTRQAAAEIKKDYPEDTFEKTLLEFAVSYESWETRLRNRLLMEKVVDSLKLHIGYYYIIQFLLLMNSH